MNYKTIIQLYDLEILNREGKVNNASVADMGYEEGSEFARAYASGSINGLEPSLLLMEGNIKSAYCMFDNHDFWRLLAVLAESIQHELSEAAQAVTASDEALGIFLENFLMGLSDVFLEKYKHCQKAEQK